MRYPRITIITFAWPPRNSIGAHRPVSWAKHWSEAGAKVRVITAKKYEYDAPLDLAIPSLDDVEIIEVDYSSAKTKFASTIFSSKIKKYIVKLYKLINKKSSSTMNPRRGWFDAASKYAIDTAHDTDIVISTYDPKAVHQLASLMKKTNPEITWIADYRDLWSLSHVSKLTERQKNNERMLEKFIVGQSADAISSVSDQLTRKQADFLSIDSITITNGFEKNQEEVFLGLNKKIFSKKKSLNIVYTGRIYAGLQDPLPLVKVISKLESKGVIPKGMISINVYGGNVDAAYYLLKNTNWKHIVFFHGHVTREKALSAQSEADILLLLESSSDDANGVLTGKIFEYMASGTPVLSLGSQKKSAICQIIQETGIGFCAGNDEELIEKILLSLVNGNILSWYTPKIDRIMKYSRKSQADKLYKFMCEKHFS